MCIRDSTWLVTDFMQSLQETNISVDFLLQKANGFVDLLKKHPEIRQDLVLTSFMQSVQTLLLSEDKMIASIGYRISRYLINGEEFIRELIRLRLDSFIIISLAKDNTFQIEREQALKLVRCFIDHKAGITCGIVQGIISCVEKQDDLLRNLALETLLELCFVDPAMVKQCHGIRLLVGLLQDYSSFSLASIILDTILQLLETKKTRIFILEDFNVAVLGLSLIHI